MEPNCFLFHAPWYRTIYLVVGIPCISILLACVLVTVLGLAGITWFNPLVFSKFVKLNTKLSSQYGFLLDPIHSCDVQLDIDGVDRQVNFWMIAGAISAMFYAAALMGLAVSHQSYTGYIEASVSFAMCASKLTVAFCAHKVHRNLSKDARDVVGNWVLVLAVSKLSMSLCGLLQGFAYLLATIVSDVPSQPHPSDPAFCKVLFFFTAVCGIAIVFQTSAALSLFRIQQLTLSSMTNTNGTKWIVSLWVVLVSCTFGVGLALWSAGGLFVLGGWDLGRFKMATAYLIASLFQFTFGITMLIANGSIKTYFAEQHREQSSQELATIVGS